MQVLLLVRELRLLLLLLIPLKLLAVSVLFALDR
jgi:hypothetical protein